MDISVSSIHNDMINPYENLGLASVVDSVTQKFMICDTTTISFILPPFSKMTTKLRQICGCEFFIIPKDMQIDLNIFRTILEAYLQQKSVGKHTCNSLFSTKSAANYKDDFSLW